MMWNSKSNMHTAIKVFNCCINTKKYCSIPDQNENVTFVADIRDDVSKMKQLILDIQKYISTILSLY